MVMTPGTLIFVHGSGILPFLIRWVTKSRYSHVAVYVGDGKLIEAQALRTVGFQPLSAYEGDYDAVPVSVPQAMLENGLMWLYAQQGRHYSYWSDFVILIRCLFGIMIPWHEGKAVMCARLARDFCFYCGLPVPDTDMSPEELYEFVKGG